MGAGVERTGWAFLLFDGLRSSKSSKSHLFSKGFQERRREPQRDWPEAPRGVIHFRGRRKVGKRGE